MTGLLPVLAQTAGELLPGAPEVAPATGGSAELVLFVIIAPLALGTAISVVVLRNAVHAALMLVVNFFTIAVLFAILEAQFLAIVQIIVYAGAIMVLFLFVIMLLGVGSQQGIGERIRGQRPAAALLGVALLIALVPTVAGPYLGRGSVCGDPGTAATAGAEAPAGTPCVGLAAANAQDEGNVRGVGRLIFTDYVWPFEVTSVLLVIAALGAMVLGRKAEADEDLTDQPRREPVPVGPRQRALEETLPDEPAARVDLEKRT